MARASVGLRVIDVALMVCVAASTAGVALWAYDSGGGGFLSVQNGADEWLYPLNVDRRIDVPGPLGLTEIDIADGVARVVDSPCRDKVCVAMGRLESSGDWSACLPNGVLARITGERDDGIDAIVY